MSKYEQRDNSGSLFKVDDDKKRDRGPDYSGTAMIDGTEYFMDAWLKTSESGRRWMSFSFKPKQKQAPKPAAPKQRPKDEQWRAGAADDSDVPF